MQPHRALSTVLALTLAAGLLPASWAFAADAGTEGGSDAAPTEGGAETAGVIVTLAPELAGFSLLAAGDGLDAGDVVEQVTTGQLEAMGLDVETSFEGAQGETLLVAAPAEGMSDYEAARAAEALPGVASAQPNFVYHLIDTASADVQLAASSPLKLLEAVNDPYLESQYWIGAAHLDEAWDLVHSDHGSTIALMDAAVFRNHEDLAANVLASYAWDTSTGTGAPLDWNSVNVHARQGHGTHVSGIMAAVTGNGVGVAGASYNGYVLPINVVDANGKGYTSNLLPAYTYLMQLASEHPELNIHACNMSLGYQPTMNDDGSVNLDDVDVALNTAIRAARNAGIVTVCAGGNWGTENRYVLPADWDSCMSVTALTEAGGDWSGGDYNDKKDISAPGIGIFSTTSDGLYGLKSGTSMAAPVVSGALALLAADQPDASADELVEAITATADPVEHTAHSSMTGSAGALNVGAAVAYLRGHVLFDDVRVPSAYYYEPVYWAVDESVTTGYDDNTFRPGNVCMRKQVVSFLWRAFGSPEPASTTCPFEDVHEGDYFYKAVLWAVEQDITTGRSDTVFDPNAPCTRAQVVTFLWRAMGKPQVTGASTFADVPADAYFAPAVRWASQTGVTTGTSPTTFNPQGTCTRGQVVTFLFRAVA